MSMSGGSIYTIDYIIYPDATIDMKVTFNSSSNYRRVGLGMQFTGGFENVEYYARGPWSNYVDRKTGSYLGRYVTTVDDMIEENIHPQTYGDHQDLRELILSNGNVALTIKTGGNVAYSLSHYDETQYCGTGDTMWSDGTHWYDLTKSNQILPISTIGNADLATVHAVAIVVLTSISAPTAATLTPCASLPRV